MRTILAVISFTLFAVGCTSDEPSTDQALGDINCSSDAICATSYGGGVCREHLCRATNVCATDADCDAPQLCVRSSVFHAGLCATPNTAPSPEPAASCSSAAGTPPLFCPSWQECGANGHCHTRFCITDAQCPTGDSCQKLCGPLPRASSGGPVQDPIGGICLPGNIQRVCPPDDPTTPTPGS